MSDRYKQIYLEYRGHPYIVTPQAFEQIKAIIEASLICQICCNGYTDENPMIVVNVCLSCFLTRRKKDLPRGFHLVGEVTSEYARRGGYRKYKFIDQRGYVYLLDTIDEITDRIDEDVEQTLLQYGFRLPPTYTLKDESVVELGNAWRTIYGDFTTSPVVLVEYKEYHGNHVQAVFLLYRDRDPVEFTRRKKQMRLWYEQAKAEIEATFVPHIGYTITGADGEAHTTWQLYDHHMYPGIVARARKEYDQEQASTL